MPQTICFWQVFEQKMRDSKSGEARLVQDICETARRGNQSFRQVSLECRGHLQILQSTMLHASAAGKTRTCCPGCEAPRRLSSVDMDICPSEDLAGKGSVHLLII